MRRLSVFFFTIFIANTFFSYPLLVLGEGDAFAPTSEFRKQLKEARTEAGYAAPVGENYLQETIGKIIKSALGLLGTIFLVLMIYAGYLWMTAAGNEENVEKAKKLLGNAVIGLALVLTAYAITAFVVRSLVTATVTS